MGPACTLSSSPLTRRRPLASFCVVQDSKLLSRQYIDLRNSVAHRDQFLKPLNYIQTILLSRKSNPNLTEEERELNMDNLLRSIKAIASSIRNTG